MTTARDQRQDLLEKLIGREVADGRFKITELLGFGGMGAVYGAVQKNMGRSVALKLIPTHDPTTVARFEREALTISKLRHPNTITVFDYGQTEDNFLFLSMEMLEGKTLTELIEEGPRSPEDMVHITSQICRSLSEAHRNGIVHRDVKPDNVILIAVDDDPNVVKVLDFGIAKAVLGEDDVELTGDGRIVGTPRYMSPEQILAESVDHRTDIYALGCIMYEMLCGAPPFQQKSTTALMISHTQDLPPSFSQRLDHDLMSQMPTGIEKVVRKALEKKPEDRYQSCNELRRELRLALAGMELGSDLGDIDSSSDFSSSILDEDSISTRTLSAPDLESKADKRSMGLISILVILSLVVLSSFLLSKLVDSQKVDPAPPKVAMPLVIEEEKAKEIEVSSIVKPSPDKVEFVRFEIQTQPPGASISENGSYIGKTPLEFPVKTTQEKVSLTLNKEGYKDLPILLFVDPQKIKTLKTFDLEKEKAERKTKPRRVRKTVRDEVRKVKEKPKIKMLGEDDEPKVKVLE